MWNCGIGDFYLLFIADLNLKFRTKRPNFEFTLEISTFIWKFCVSIPNLNPKF